MLSWSHSRQHCLSFRSQIMASSVSRSVSMDLVSQAVCETVCCKCYGDQCGGCQMMDCQKCTHHCSGDADCWKSQSLVYWKYLLLFCFSFVCLISIVLRYFLCTQVVAWLLWYHCYMSPLYWLTFVLDVFIRSPLRSLVCHPSIHLLCVSLPLCESSTRTLSQRKTSLRAFVVDINGTASEGSICNQLLTYANHGRTLTRRLTGRTRSLSLSFWLHVKNYAPRQGPCL
jgi:hypothetical protein